MLIVVTPILSRLPPGCILLKTIGTCSVVEVATQEQSDVLRVLAAMNPQAALVPVFPDPFGAFISLSWYPSASQAFAHYRTEDGAGRYFARSTFGDTHDFDTIRPLLQRVRDALAQYRDPLAEDV